MPWRLPSGCHWRHIRQSVSGCAQAGLGSLFYCVALSGSQVSRGNIRRTIHFGQLSALANRDEKYVALKVVKSAPHYIETAADEIRLLEAIRDADPLDVKRERIVRLMNHFTVRGVNGVHTCLVFEALGCSLYKLIVKNNYQGLAIAQVRNIIKQVLEGLDYLHSKCSIIHTDIKPENILLVIDNAAAMNQQIDDEINSLRVKGVDFPDSYSKCNLSQRLWSWFSFGLLTTCSQFD